MKVPALTAPGELFDALDGGRVRCRACANECVIEEGKSGTCRVRSNAGGRLLVPFGYSTGLRAEPIEKKPFFHVLPASSCLSFGMLGCNLSCRWCQNWTTSQAMKDPDAHYSGLVECSPEKIVEQAQAHGCPTVVSTYNEPLITAEWAAAIFRKAKEAGLRCGFVSNGYATRRCLEYLRPWVDFYKVDLKGFDERRFREATGGRLAAVLESIASLLELGVWVEVVTLVVPGFNDSDKELGSIARFLEGLSKDIPWHVTAFHQDYKLLDGPDTPAGTLLRAAEIGRAEGLRYVYAGNLQGSAAELEDTNCPHCRKVVIERRGFRVFSNRLKSGRCPDCAEEIPGVWE